MATTKLIELCNSALIRLDERVLPSTFDIRNPGNSNERYCAQLFEDTLKSVLSEHSFNIIKLKSALTIDSSNPPEFGFTNRFPYPSDCTVLKLVNVWVDDVLIKNKYNLHYNYSIEGESIVTDGSTCQIEYTYYPVKLSSEDDEDFDTKLETYLTLVCKIPSMKRAIISALAFQLCFPITHNATLKNTLYAEYMDALEKAITKNSSELPRMMFKDRTLLNCRVI